MDQRQQRVGTPKSPNAAQLDLKGELASTVTHGVSDDGHAERRPTVEDTDKEQVDLRFFRISNADDSLRFCSNYIKTTKYTMWSYLPLATLYQYKKLANWYFLLMSVLSCLPISPWSPVTMVFPTVFVVLLSVLREGYEDYFRYKSDKQSNRQSVRRVLRDGTVEEITSGEVLVGDILYVGDDEDIPADVLLLGGGVEHEQPTSSSPGAALNAADSQMTMNDQAVCFLQTSSLDGEKNLKKKVTPQGFKGVSLEGLNLAGESELASKFREIEGTIICDLPNNDLHQFHGSLRMKSPSTGKTKTYALGPKQLLLKGSRLINTAKGILGVVIYSGIDTKLMQNQHAGRHKQSKLEKETNKIVVRLLILHSLVSILLSWQSYRWDSTEGDGQYYLYKHNDPEAAPSRNLSADFILNFLSGFLINSTFVPISLIVTLELVKVVQGAFISWDFEMVGVEFDEGDLQVKPIQESEPNEALKPQKQPISFQKCKVLTCSINEELGQVRYVFSDKTGTLTMNAMEFRLCKIGHQVYGDQQAEPYIGPKHMQDIVEERSLHSGGLPRGHGQIQHRAIVQELASESVQSSVSQRSSVRSTVNRKQGASYNYHNLQLEQILFGNEISEFGQQEQLKCNLTIHSKEGKASLIFENQKKLIAEFLQCLATTHECVPEEKKAKTEDGSEIPVVGYQGPSPDEVALLEFAQNHGYEYTKGSDDCLQVTKKHKVYNNMSNAQSFSSLQPPRGQAQAEMPQWVTDRSLDFKLLKRIEFSSDRKRMSVVVQDLQDGQFKLYCKGADNIIKERLREGYMRPGKPGRKHVDTPEPFELKKPLADYPTEDVRMMDETDQFLQQCSMDGYRTLLVAMRVLDQDEANQFVTECTLAESDVANKDEKLDQVYDKWERELSLLGATVLEDRLQENVQNTIQSLHQADIKVWVLTGDKLETAESIGYSSKLLTLNMEVLRCRDAEDVRLLFNRDCASKHESEVLSGMKKALVIESEALKVILSDGDLKIQRYFLKITKTFETVICCRVSPRQKAEVVKLIKEDDPEVVTLAIGDGANDVSMILEADLGIGLFGNEGMRAADSSDFAICQFQHLWPLLFKQGRWLYARISFLVIYSLYKSFLYTILQVLFARINCYSFQTVFPDFFLTMFNTWFTAWPVPFHCCIDLDLFPGKERIEGEDDLMHFEGYDPFHLRKFIPSLYFQGQRNMLFNQYTFLWWMIRGLYEGLIAFFITAEAFQESFVLHRDGQPGDLWTMGITMFTCVMFIVTSKILIKHKKIDWHVPACHLLLSSVGNYFLYLWTTDSWQSFRNHFTFEFLFTSPIVYLIVFLVVGICFLIDFALESVSYNITTSSYDLIRYQTLEKDAEETQEFVDEFERMTQCQRRLGVIKDSVREQQLDYRRAIKAGLAPEELREEMRLNQAIERNLGGVKGLFQSLQSRFSTSTGRNSKVNASSGHRSSHRYHHEHRSQHPDHGHRLSRQEAGALSHSQPGSHKQQKQRKGDLVTAFSAIQNAEMEKANQYEMEFIELRPGTPEKSRERRETKVKTDRKSMVSTQKNLVSPIHHESYQAEARSPERAQTIFKEYEHTPSQQPRRTPQPARIQKTVNANTGASLRPDKSAPATGASESQTPIKPSLTLNAKPQPNSDGFINLQRHSSTRHHDHSERVLRVDCFDKSFDSRRASSNKRHRQQASLLSSRQLTVNESIAEEPASKRPNQKSVIRANNNEVPEKSEKYIESQSDLNMVSGRNSISNLQVDPSEELRLADSAKRASLQRSRTNPQPSPLAAQTPQQQ